MTFGDAGTETVRLQALIDDLRRLPAEASWVEFKENNADPQMIGKLISALSNAARLADQHFAYVVWGIRDGDHAVTGTSFEPSRQKEQNQGLELWLSQRLQPGCAITFKAVEYQGTKLILLEIPAASTSPVEFDRTAYIRIGSATPRLSDYPEVMRALWAKLQPYVWENGVALPVLMCEEQGTGIDKVALQNASQASAVIRAALDKGLIRSADPDHPRAGYVPHWA